MQFPHSMCACVCVLCLSTDQVWQRRVGGRLCAVREEERFVSLYNHPRCYRAHAAHHRHLHLLLQVSRSNQEFNFLLVVGTDCKGLYNLLKSISSIKYKVFSSVFLLMKILNNVFLFWRNGLDLVYHVGGCQVLE